MLCSAGRALGVSAGRVLPKASELPCVLWHLLLLYLTTPNALATVIHLLRPHTNYGTTAIYVPRPYTNSGQASGGFRLIQMLNRAVQPNSTWLGLGLGLGLGLERG